ncbi:MAG TPA: C25 family cysteine peptidase, partial [Anaerolineales bacterium]|nr:C25 family cysteine peptidase [Anaerolineales bacterium]
MPRTHFIRGLIWITLLSLVIPVGQAEAVFKPPAGAGLHVLRSDESGLLIELDTLHYTLQRDASREQLSVPGFESSSEPGQPLLPVKSILLGAPPGAQVEVHWTEEQAGQVEENVDLASVPIPAAPIADLQPGGFIDASAPRVGSGDQFYPPNPVRIAGDAWLRDLRIVRLEIYPFQYNRQKSRLLWHKQLQVEVKFVLDQSNVGSLSPPRLFSSSRQVNDPFDKLLKGQLVNYEIAQSWKGIPTDSADIPLARIGDQQNTSGPRYRIVVVHDGIYQLTYTDLKNAGMDVDAVDPRNFHLSSQGQNIAIDVVGEADGKFDFGDSIKFYGQKFYGDHLAQEYAIESTHWMTYSHQLSDGSFVLWHPEFNATMLEKYTGENVYWLSVATNPGLRMDPDSLAGPPGISNPVPPYFISTVHAEQSHEWYTYNFSGEDTWFWDRIRTATTRPYTTTLSAVASIPVSATVRAEAVARIFANHQFDHHTQFQLNSLSQPVDDKYWNGISRYSFETQIPQSALVEGENQLKLSLLLDAYPGQFADDIYFDWFEIDYAHLFKANKDYLAFSRDESGGPWKYEISDFTSGAAEVYEISDPPKPKKVIGPVLQSGTLSFEGNHAGQVSYAVAGTSALQKPESITFYDPPDLKSSSNAADYIFITHRDFYTATQILADYRRAQGLSTKVVDVQDLYNEFNYGIFNPIAIKNFLAYTFAVWQKAPTYVLLVGDGHWNFKGYQSNSYPTVNYSSPTPVYMPPNLAWVDPWQGEVDSTNLLATVIGTDPLPDLNIGRLPVNSVAELNTVIQKIMNYENSPLGDWQYNLVFAADNKDSAGDFKSLADGIINDIIPSAYRDNRIYLDDLGSAALAKQSLIQALNVSGAVLLNYIGHAAIDGWANEGIFDNSDIQDLNNAGMLPVVLSMDCLDGYWFYPSQSSLTEEMLRAESKGAVSTFSPAGLGVATGHDALQRGFYDAVFNQDIRELGPATLAGKLSLYVSGGNYDLLHTFTVFGDPA